MKSWMIMSAGVISSLLLMSCSTLIPYEENFACRNRDNLGKCLDVDRAYGEAVDDTHHYGHFDENAGAGNSPVHADGDPGVSDRDSDRVTRAFRSYKQREYRELSSLIESPVTPVVKPPRVIRTLILPYAGTRDDRNKQYLYMPRYVYSILEEERWVLGNYLTGDTASGSFDNLIR